LNREKEHVFFLLLPGGILIVLLLWWLARKRASDSASGGAVAVSGGSISSGGGGGGGSSGGGGVVSSVLSLFGIGGSSSSSGSAISNDLSMANNLVSAGSKLSSSLSAVGTWIQGIFSSDGVSLAGGGNIPETELGGALGELQSAAEANSISTYGVDLNSSSSLPGEAGFQEPYFEGINLGENGDAMGFNLSGVQAPQMYEEGGEVFTYPNTSTNADNELQTDYELGGGTDYLDLNSDIEDFGGSGSISGFGSATGDIGGADCADF
jgi:hypothetical protein